jgi:hypothetical protein
MIDFASLRPDLLHALRSAGWQPDRKVSVGPWLEALQREGYVPHREAEEILAALGGLEIEPVNRSGLHFSNDEPFKIDPIAAGSGHRDLALEIEKILGGTYFPIGEWLSYSSVFIEAGGRVVAAGLGWIWEMGRTFEGALELAVFADRPLLCLHTDPGLDPWPK